MSGSQSRNDVSLSEATEPETEVLYSEDMKAHIDHFNHHANEIAESIDRLVTGTLRSAPVRNRTHTPPLPSDGRAALEELQRRFVGRLER